MHIVYITREYPPTLRGGGIASYVRDVAHELVSQGHQVTVICASDDTRYSADFTDGNLRVIRLSGGDFVVPSVEKAYPWRKLRGLTRFYSYRRKIRTAVETLKNVDIIEVAEYGAEAYYITDCGIPLTIRLHTPALLDRKTCGVRKLGLKCFYEWVCAIQERKITCNCNCISSCSLSLSNWVQRYFLVSGDKIKVIYNPLRVSDWRQELVVKKIPMSVLYVGTVAEEKGVGDLVDACRILRKKGVPLMLSIAGKMGTYGISLRERLGSQGASWCKFLGNVAREQLKGVYSAHEIACFPSLWDNLPIVCLESMVSGCITIGSSSGGMSEIIEHEKDGYLVPPHDPNVLAGLLEKVLSLPEAEKEIIRNAAKRKIIEEFSMKVISDKLLNFYQYVISEHNKL